MLAVLGREPKTAEHIFMVRFHIVACLLGNVTNNLWILDLILDLLDIRQAELQLIITLLILP
jgi:hypothetical protein